MSAPDASRLRRRRRRLATAALAAYSLLGCAACGAAPAPGGHPRRATTASIASSAAPTPPVTSAVPGASTPGCAETVAGTLGGIAARIYHEAATGGPVSEAVHRVTGSVALAHAVSSGDAGATRSILRSLLAGQIVRIEVLRGARLFASAGSGAAVAPVAGTIPQSGGARFLLSVQSEHSYLQVAQQVTGAEVVLLAGTHRLAGTLLPPAGTTIPTSGPLSIGAHSYQVASLGGSEFPSGALRIAILVPSSELSCPAEAAQTRTTVLGRVGERIYEEEAGSSYVQATVRRMESSAAFQRAVASRDVAATRAAIVGFFAAHIHVVRVRVTVGGKLLYDLGGPHVLAPVEGTLRVGGRVVGHFLMAIQDDAGYLKLAQLFTGAEVLMRTGGIQVAGTLDPGPEKVPDRGTVSYRGRTFQAYSFTGTAFPSGPLRISLLF